MLRNNLTTTEIMDFFHFLLITPCADHLLKQMITTFIPSFITSLKQLKYGRTSADKNRVLQNQLAILLKRNFFHDERIAEIAQRMHDNLSAGVLNMVSLEDSEFEAFITSLEDRYSIHCLNSNPLGRVFPPVMRTGLIDPELQRTTGSYQPNRWSAKNAYTEALKQYGENKYLGAITFTLAAIEYLESIPAASRLGKDADTLLQCKSHLLLSYLTQALEYYSSENFSTAQQYLHEASKYVQTIPGHDKARLLYNRVATIFTQQAELDDLCKQNDDDIDIIDQFEIGNYRRNIASNVANIADFYLHEHMHDMAERLYDHALSCFQVSEKALHDRDLECNFMLEFKYANALNLMGARCHKQGQYSEAIAYQEQATALLYGLAYDPYSCPKVEADEDTNNILGILDELPAQHAKYLRQLAFYFHGFYRSLDNEDDISEAARALTLVISNLKQIPEKFKTEYDIKFINTTQHVLNQLSPVAITAPVPRSSSTP